jgi:hypothetical protein
VSSGGRLTLTITPGRPLVPVLWTFSTEQSLPAAIENLRRREGCCSGNIGVWLPDGKTFRAQREQTLLREEISRWWRQLRSNEERPIDAVIWTDLGPKFQESGETGRRDFNMLNAVNYLNGLNADEWLAASTYILRAPDQIQTSLRPGLESFIHDRNLTEGFTRPTLGPRANLHPVDLAEIPVLTDGINQLDEPFEPLKVWVNGQPGEVWIHERYHFSTRFEMRFDHPFPHAAEQKGPDGKPFWTLGTGSFMEVSSQVMMVGPWHFRFHHRVTNLFRS